MSGKYDDICFLATSKAFFSFGHEGNRFLTGTATSGLVSECVVLSDKYLGNQFLTFPCFKGFLLGTCHS